MQTTSLPACYLKLPYVIQDTLCLNKRLLQKSFPQIKRNFCIEVS